LHDAGSIFFVNAISECDVVGYGRRGLMGEMMALFDEMLKSGIMPDLFVYNTLLNALSRYSFSVTLVCFIPQYRKGMLKEMTDLFSDMKERNIQPTVWSYNSLISCLGRKKMVDNMMKVYEGIASLS
jgi:pentatricopeptide repeat protein